MLSFESQKLETLVLPSNGPLLVTSRTGCNTHAPTPHEDIRTEPSKIQLFDPCISFSYYCVIWEFIS